jgi:hypothetical protein
LDLHRLAPQVVAAQICTSTSQFSQAIARACRLPMILTIGAGRGDGDRLAGGDRVESGGGAPYRVDDDHVLFGYVFQCFTARRNA